MQYARFPVGKSRKNRVTDKESKGFAYLYTNLNDWGMSDIFNSSHFLRGTNEVLPDQPRKLGRSRNLLGEQEGKALHIAKRLFLPFYLLPFYLLRTGRRTEQSAELIQRRRVHGPPVMDWVHPAIRDRVDFL